VSGTTTPPAAGWSTLLLDQTVWDLVLDASGNIAVASPPYSIAQDVATACRTFLGECYYDTTLGVPYFGEILGRLPPTQLIKQQIVDQALTVPGVTIPVCYLTGFAGRRLTGQIQFTGPDGTTQVAGF